VLSSVAALETTDIVLELVATSFMPSIVCVDLIVPKLLNVVSLKFQLFDDAACVATENIPIEVMSITIESNHEKNLLFLFCIFYSSF
jgi:hypothetical protein